MGALKKPLLNILVKSILGAALVFSATTVLAEDKLPAQQQTQVAGYYRMILGDYEITALYDGFVQIDSKLLKGITAKDVNKLLQQMFIDSSNGVQTSINGFLIHTNKHLILIDAGAASCFGDTAGQIENNLKAAGYTLEQVDTVLLTHLHPDHACGVTKEGKRVFPNATLYVPQAEAGYWLSKKSEEQAPEAAKGTFKMAQQAVAPYQAANKFKTFTDRLPVNEVQLMASPGHTPGHMSYLVTSKGNSLLIWGDIVHSHAVQFTRPEVAIEYDSNSEQAVASRKKILAYAAKNKLWVAGAHLPFPGLGHVRANDKGYTWVPVEYSPILKKQN